METYYGKSVSSGIVSGKILCLQKRKDYSLHIKAENADVELDKFQTAVKKLETDLDEMKVRFYSEERREEAELAEAHKLILTSPEFLDNCRMKIKEERLSAMCAVYEAGELLASHFENITDSFLLERLTDVSGVLQQILTILDEDAEELLQLTEPVIVAAEELTPAEILRFDKNKVLAMVVKKGSQNSHTAILARLWNIPALIDVDIKSDWNGQNAVVDGEKGIVYLNPTIEIMNIIDVEKKSMAIKQDNLKEYIGLDNQSKSGKKIKIYANVGNVEDVQEALDNDAGGIGLFRTEFLYMGRDMAPTEEEQYEIYRDVVIAMKDKPVIIRTMDIGMDKCVDYIRLPKEDNPALGLRGIRVSFACEEIFKTQIKAILRASAFGDVRIMFPMVTSVNEVRKARELIDQVRGELKLQNYPYGDVKIGVMIETPAAAILSDILAKEVDFFSIGTNDLTQYTLAMDRQNSTLLAYYDSGCEAVLRMIKMTVENAHASNIPVGICGELAKDTGLTAQFLEWGVDELSLSPSKILEVRASVLRCD